MTHFLSGRRRFLRMSIAGCAAASVPLGQVAGQAMAQPATITLADVNRMDLAAFLKAFGEVYEFSPWVAEAAYAKRPFATVTALHQALADSFAAASRERQFKFLHDLSDIGDKSAKAETVTDASRGEQKASGINALNATDQALLEALNKAYRQKFDMAFVICVRRNTVAWIFSEYERRMNSSSDSELEVAIREQSYITRLRIAELVTGEGMPKVYGELSAHVLDAMVGKPAQGVAVELYEIWGEQSHKVAQGVTNADGRAIVMSGQPLPIGRYELRFAIGDYYRKTGAIASGEKPFLDVVPMRMFISKPEEGYHFPLVATPFSYTIHG